ncbi:MAG: hypothetical protein MUE72_00830 [Chitinophagaceae bacterium]|nr:hypothetical protein [Chitinophagaceae bacterium]
MKCLLILITILGFTAVQAQTNYVVLKKRGMPIKRYYNGNFIQFYSAENYLIEGFINYCKNDSIFIRLGNIHLVGSGFGTKIDTVLYGFYQIHVKDVKLIPNRNLVLKLGVLGGAVVAVNNINLQPNIRNVVQYISVGLINILVAKATLFKRKRPEGYKLGKKYKLEYISISDPLP